MQKCLALSNEHISYRCYKKRKYLHMCGNNYVQMCFEKNILCADVFCVFNWFETIQHQPSASRFGEEKLPWFTEAITNDLTNNGDVDDQLNALFRIKGRFRGQERCFLKDQ